MKRAGNAPRVDVEAGVALKVVFWGYVLEVGRIAFQGITSALAQDERVRTEK